MTIYRSILHCEYRKKFSVQFNLINARITVVLLGHFKNSGSGRCKAIKILKRLTLNYSPRSLNIIFYISSQLFYYLYWRIVLSLYVNQTCGFPNKSQTLGIITKRWRDFEIGIKRWQDSRFFRQNSPVCI